MVEIELKLYNILKNTLLKSKLVFTDIILEQNNQ